MGKKVVILLGSSGKIGKEVLIGLREVVDVIEYDRRNGVFHRDSIVLNDSEILPCVTHIVNCAGLNRGAERELYQANVLFPKDLARKVSAFNSKFVFIQISSYGIFNGNKSLKNIRQRVPLNQYELSKSAVIDELEWLKERLIILTPTNVAETTPLKSWLRFLFWPVKSRILLTSTKYLANCCLLCIQDGLWRVDNLIVSRRIETGLFELRRLKSWLHELLIVCAPKMVPYYLFYFEYREE